MCLAVPARLLSMNGEDPLLRTGRVDFGGVERDVSLAFVPDAVVGDHLLIHVGVAIAVLDGATAAGVIDTLNEIGA